jgi:hypothetical protein
MVDLRYGGYGDKNFGPWYYYWPTTESPRFLTSVSPFVGYQALNFDFHMTYPFSTFFDGVGVQTGTVEMTLSFDFLEWRNRPFFERANIWAVNQRFNDTKFEGLFFCGTSIDGSVTGSFERTGDITEHYEVEAEMILDGRNLGTYFPYQSTDLFGVLKLKRIIATGLESHNSVYQASDEVYIACLPNGTLQVVAVAGFNGGDWATPINPDADYTINAGTSALRY